MGGSHPAFGGSPRAASWYQAYPSALTGPATTKPSAPALIVPSWVAAVPALARTARPSTVDLARWSTVIVSAAGDELGEAAMDAVEDGCGTGVGLAAGVDPVFAAAQPARITVIASGRSLRTFNLRSRRELGDQRIHLMVHLPVGRLAEAKSFAVLVSTMHDVHRRANEAPFVRRLMHTVTSGVTWLSL